MFVDHPRNPRYPTGWFVRNHPYACMSASFMFEEEYPLQPGTELALRYRVVIGDGEWSRERIEEYVEQCWKCGISRDPWDEDNPRGLGEQPAMIS